MTDLLLTAVVHALGGVATPPSGLNWNEIFANGEKAAKIVAIIIAGVVGYYKFLRGRVFRPRLEMTVSSSLFLIGQQQYIKVVATLKNTGASRITFDLENSALRIFAAPLAAREIVDSVSWEQIGILNVGGRHSWIEPAETVYENWLIVLPAEAANPAFRGELRITGKTTAWYADTIVERQPVLLSASPKDNNPPSERRQEVLEEQTPKEREENERIRREKEEQERRRQEEERRIQREKENSQVEEHA
jgi:hypothetical protein